MKNSEINFKISLDEKNIPSTIEWDATDKENEGMETTNSIS